MFGFLLGFAEGLSGFGQIIFAALYGEIGAGVQEGMKLNLGFTQLFRDLTIFPRLNGLFFEASEPLFDLKAQVFGAGKVGFGLAKFQFRIMAAGMKARDASGLFQQKAALFGLGRDKLADTVLADDGRASCTGRQIGKKRLHVTRTHDAAIDTVFAAGATLGTTRDFKIFSVLKWSGGKTLGAGQMKRDLSDVPGRTCACSSKDQVVQLATPEGAGGGLTHGPAQAFDDIGFAAAIWTDNARQARKNVNAHLIGEAFEAADHQAADRRGVR
ncbi:hypothetical protein AA3271_1322 [Gluconobacter japonicus NBRC 3271]|nr:hypothetical protein AA3271_1322 [Gluconobacter japonicus NBRC 3271]